jgi:hypothetical protein
MALRHEAMNRFSNTSEEDRMLKGIFLKHIQALTSDCLWQKISN